ncbi:MAG: hypothetical protein COB22_02470 [Cycloclasticus sp.]|nr:MAG: hypothetical protein COB22_02470 [Cycloclasticus sp.]
MQEHEKTIRSVLLPLTNESVLLPHSAMMEVLPERDITPVENRAKWVIGEVIWNNKPIPLVAMEMVFGAEKVEKPKRSRIVIVACLSAENDYQYIAIRTTGVPRLVQFKDETLKLMKFNGLSDEFIQFYGELNHQMVIIPDMKKLESCIVVSHVKKKKTV